MLIIKFLIIGFLFGAIMQYSKVNTHNAISGMSTFESFIVAKTMAIAIGLGLILLNIEIALGFASYHIIPLFLIGVIAGGLIFGAGMAILGYCPGTLPISLGQGSLDALVGSIGGFFAVAVYSVISPELQGYIGPNFGQISLHSLLGSSDLFYALVFIIGSVFISIAFMLQKADSASDYKWLYSGIGLATLFSASFSHFLIDNVLGASTAFLYMGDTLLFVTDTDYFKKWEFAGYMQSFFILGAFLAGLIISIIKKEFRLVLMHAHWVKYKGPSKIKRIIWAFIGGFLLFTGARLAGGCTSGHIISGGIQLALSSFVFAFFVFTGLLTTGRLFYR